MANTFVQDGDRIDYTPSSDVSAGDVVVLADLIGVATEDIAANALGSLAVSGIFDMVKDTGTINVGTKLYWDATDEELQTTDDSGTNKYFGKAVETSAGATIKCRLSQ